jgi:hypothetical protein
MITKCLERGTKEEKTSKGIQTKLELRNIPNLSHPPQSPRAVHTKNITQPTYELRFLCSTYL